MSASYRELEPLVPAPEELENMRHLVGFLMQFFILTQKIEKEKHITAAGIIPDYNAAIDHCDECYDDPRFEFMQPAIDVCRNKLIEYYSKTNVVTMAAAYFDPRNRKDYFVLEQFPALEVAELETFVRSEYETKVGQAANEVATSDASNPGSTSTSAAATATNNESKL